MNTAKSGNTAKGGLTVSIECLDRMTDTATEADKKVRALAELAGIALESLEQRKGEDVNEWARRIANDVCEADD